MSSEQSSFTAKFLSSFLGRNDVHQGKRPFLSLTPIVKSREELMDEADDTPPPKQVNNRRFKERIGDLSHEIQTPKEIELEIVNSKFEQDDPQDEPEGKPKKRKRGNKKTDKALNPKDRKGLQRPKKAPFSRNELREMGFFSKLRTVEYEKVVGLHKIWKGYAASIGMSAATLPRLDFHGSHLTVIRSKSFGFVGMSGICIQETQFLFRIVREDNRVIDVPKASCILQIRGPDGGKGVIFGNGFKFRAEEKSRKRFKPDFPKELY